MPLAYQIERLKSNGFPLWESPDRRIVLVHADCLEVLPELEAGSVDAVVTDPPWGVANNNANRSRGRGHSPYAPNTDAKDFPPCAGDDSPFDPTPWLIFRNIVMWGANHFADKLPASPFWLVWDRKAGKAADSDTTDCELAWTRGTHYRTVRQFSHMWAGFQRDSEAGNIHLHPMQKPVELMRWSIDWMPKSDIVCDPYAGCCPTAIACIRTDRRCICIEKEEKYWQIGIDRCKREYARTALFDEMEAVP
jgi:site-specific DNA-methyltransferase (adenine-specific)/modification methylase